MLSEHFFLPEEPKLGEGGVGSFSISQFVREIREPESVDQVLTRDVGVMILSRKEGGRFFGSG